MGGVSVIWNKTAIIIMGYTNPTKFFLPGLIKIVKQSSLAKTAGDELTD